MKQARPQTAPIMRILKLVLKQRAPGKKMLRNIIKIIMNCYVDLSTFKRTNLLKQQPPKHNESLFQSQQH